MIVNQIQYKKWCKHVMEHYGESILDNLLL